jgi:hypothetical protein
MKNKPITGYVIYKGPSKIDGNPIVVIAIVSKSKNSKTGNMVQTYILADNGLSPLESAMRGYDKSICGNCIHRRYENKGACYVNLGQGPSNIMKAYLNGRYPESLESAKNAVKGRTVRIGSYGDGAAVPLYVWTELLTFADGHTGYTHQWQNEEKREYLNILMASVDNNAEWLKARHKGFRTFRVRKDTDKLNKGEFICPASKEKELTHCVKCQACNGGINSNKGNPVIIVHGTLKKRFNIQAI